MSTNGGVCGASVELVFTWNIVSTPNPSITTPIARSDNGMIWSPAMGDSSPSAKLHAAMPT